MVPRGTGFHHRLPPGARPPREAPRDGGDEPAAGPGTSANLPGHPTVSPRPSQAGSSRPGPSSWTQQGWASHAPSHSRAAAEGLGINNPSSSGTLRQPPPNLILGSAFLRASMSQPSPVAAWDPGLRGQEEAVLRAARRHPWGGGEGTDEGQLLPSCPSHDTHETRGYRPGPGVSQLN